MNVRTVFDLINTVAPFDTQMEGDNSGLLVGSPSREVRSILFALDVTGPVIDEAAALGADLIVTHHPLMFSAIRSLTDETYEGRLIQTGFKGAKGSSGVQSNEFNFSVVNKEIADSLMRCSGKNVELRYKEYNGALPWRGMQHYIVYEIISVNDAKSGGTEIPIVVGDV